MAGLSNDQVIAYMTGRLRGYAVICAYNVAGVIGNVALIGVFGAGATTAMQVAIAVSIVAVAAISILPAQSVFEDIKAMRADRMEGMEGSRFMANWDATPIGLFITLTFAFNAVVAAVQLWALFSA